MMEFFDSLPPVRWFREQFINCPELATDCEGLTASDLFRFVILAWVFAAVVFIAMDRLGASILGRSRPLAQEPPERARTWRWRRRTPPPPNYSLLPAGTVVQSAPPQPVAMVEQAPRPIDLTPVEGKPDEIELEVASRLPDPGIDVDDNDYWRLVGTEPAPFFGLENAARLSDGDAPERFNPVLGRVETLSRAPDDNTLWWPEMADDVLDLREIEHDETEEDGKGPIAIEAGTIGLGLGDTAELRDTAELDESE